MSAKRKPARKAPKSYPVGLSLYSVEFTTPNGTPSVANVAGSDEVSALDTLRTLRTVEKITKIVFLGYVLVPENPAAS